MSEMNNIAIPLGLSDKGLMREDSLKLSIDSSVYLLLTTPQESCPSDPGFGFIFNNLRFEMLNENEGVVYNSNEQSDFLSKKDLYDKKISGSSKNLNTFASELKEVLERYEKRLDDINVSMTYIREERKIYLTVKGTIVSTQKSYAYKTILKVWN